MGRHRPCTWSFLSVRNQSAQTIATRSHLMMTSTMLRRPKALRWSLSVVAGFRSQQVGENWLASSVQWVRKRRGQGELQRPADGTSDREDWERMGPLPATGKPCDTADSPLTDDCERDWSISRPGVYHFWGHGCGDCIKGPQTPGDEQNTSNSSHSKISPGEAAQALIYSDICIFIFLCLRLSGERSLHQTCSFQRFLSQPLMEETKEGQTEQGSWETPDQAHWT